jgi:LysR family glycine cleavage system transcriptional activator
MKKAKFPSLNALRVFDVAARSGSFKQAAQQLGVTQSAVTRQIQALEEQLDMRLFQRDNRVHSLTPVALELAPQIEQIFDQLERAIERTRSLSDNTTTQLTVAISSERFRFWLADKLEDFHALYPHIQLNFTRCADYFAGEHAADMVSAVQHQSWDIAIGYGQINDKHLQSQRLSKNDLVPVSAISTNDTPYHQSWIINPDNPEHTKLAEANQSKLKNQRIIHCDDFYMSLDLAQTEKAVTLVDSSLLNAQLSHLTPFREYAQPIKSPLSVFYKKRKRQSVALVAFIKWLQLINQ